MAARREQAPAASAQMPSPAVASCVSAVVLTRKVAACAPRETAQIAINSASLRVILAVEFIFVIFCFLLRDRSDDRFPFSTAARRARCKNSPGLRKNGALLAKVAA